VNSHTITARIGKIAIFNPSSPGRPKGNASLDQTGSSRYLHCASLRSYPFDGHKVGHPLWSTMLVGGPHQWLSIRTLFVYLAVYLAVDLAVNRIKMPERDCEFEIFNESNVLSFTVRKKINQKKKFTVHEVLKIILTTRESFSSLRIKARFLVSLISNHIQISLQLFSLFISFNMRCIIIKNTNKNVIIKQK